MRDETSGGMRHRGFTPNGFQLLELMKVVSALAIVGALVLPPMMRGLARLRVRWAAEQVASVLRGARYLAAERGLEVGVRFARGAAGELTYASYADGTGHGIRQCDVETGADPEIVAPRPLPLIGSGVRFGFPAGQRVRDPVFPGRYLPAGARPIEFGGSELAIFAPLGGGAAPGELFLTDGEALAVVRVKGGTGVSAILVYDPRAERWH